MKSPTIVTRLLKLENLVAYLLTNIGFLRQMSIVSIAEDYLICNPITNDGIINTAIDKQIAKPYLLRRSPFDGGSRNGISYAYASNVERTANNGTATEDQVIVPSYVIGDIILVRKMIPSLNIGLTTISLVDMNNDARAWAKTATEAASE